MLHGSRNDILHSPSDLVSPPLFNAFYPLPFRSSFAHFTSTMARFNASALLAIFFFAFFALAGEILC